MLLGSDPELMVIDSSGKKISAIPLFHGTKECPEKVNDGMLSHDNVNVEFGIVPATNENEWVDRTGSLLRQIADRLRVLGLKLEVNASAKFEDDQLQDRSAQEFGCEPDFDPYSFSINEVDMTEARDGLRSCGGHIHVGDNYVAEDVMRQAGMAKAMDIFVGVPSLMLDKDPSSPKRRSLYGNAGAHRPKPYGIEYRAPGNFWISHPSLTRLMYRLSADCLKAFKDGKLDGIDESFVQATINNNDLAAASKILENLVLPLLSQSTIELLRECLRLDRTDPYIAWSL